MSTDPIADSTDAIQIAFMVALINTEVWVRMTDPGEESYLGDGPFYAKGKLLKVTAGSGYGLVEFPPIDRSAILDADDESDPSPEEDYAACCSFYDAQGKRWFSPSRIFPEVPHGD